MMDKGYECDRGNNNSDQRKQAYLFFSANSSVVALMIAMNKHTKIQNNARE
jgi:hypothetical protein